MRAETDGDVEKAIALIRERGQATAAKKAGRDAREGLVYSYIHAGGRLGVLIEVNSETDFVARNEEFQKLVKDLAMQVAGLAPIYTTVESIPQAELDAKRYEGRVIRVPPLPHERGGGIVVGKVFLVNSARQCRGINR